MGWPVDAVWSVGHHMTLFKGQIMNRLKMGGGGWGRRGWGGGLLAEVGFEPATSAASAPTARTMRHLPQSSLVNYMYAHSIWFDSVYYALFQVIRAFVKTKKVDLVIECKQGVKQNNRLNEVCKRN